MANILRLRELIINNADWLIERVIKHFKTYGYAKYSSTLKEAWRISIAGMSETILSALEESDQPPALGPDLNHSDPMARFGILEAHKHRARGVNLGMFLGGLKCYRLGYIDLLCQAGFTREHEERCRLFVERVFDRVEIAFCMEWSDTAQNDLAEELQTSNLSITNEKNKYVTICESLPNPVIVFDQNNQIESMNYAAMKLFGGHCVPGQYYYTKPSSNISIPWLNDALNAFTAGNHEQTSLEKKLATKERTYFFEIKFTPLLDISEKFIGTVFTLNDITGVKRAEVELRNRFEQEKILSGISTGLINLAPNEINKVINNALKVIGKFAGVDRSYIFIFSDDLKTIDNTHEWCNSGVTPQINNLTGVSVSTFPWIMKKFERFETVNIPVVANLPPQACQEKETFNAQDIKSLIIVPLVYADDLVGFVGFDSVLEERTWHQEIIAPLKIVGEMLVNVIKRHKSEQDAQLAYQELNQIFTTAADGMRVIDSDFNVVRVNDALVALTGGRKEDAVGKKCYDLLYGSHCNTRDCPMFRIFSGEERVEGDVEKEGIDGVKIPCIATATPLRSINGELIGIVENIKDITLRKQAEETLKKSEERFRLLAENARDIIYRAQLYPVPKFEYVSPAASCVIGYDPEEFYANPLLCIEILHPDDRIIWKRASTGKFDYRKPITVRWLRRDGQVIWVEHRNVPIYDQNRLVALEGIARDVTKRKLMEEQLRYLSLHDPLTGFYNRAYFEQEMHRLGDGRHHPVGIIICDVDDLKLVNDRLGHSAGDQALVAVAGVLKKSFRKSDVIARIGGDEFTVLLPNSDISTVEKACRRVQDAQINIYPTGSVSRLSMSVGFAVSNSRTACLNDVFREADNNMYLEKFRRKRGRPATTSSKII